MAMDTQVITIVGRLGRDPESKFNKEGTQITNFSVACGNGKDANGEETTTWYNVAAFGRLAEICDQYLTKGKQVLISGALNIRHYEKKDGTPGTSFDIRANNMQMLGSKSDSNGDTSTDETPRQAHTPTRNSSQAARVTGNARNVPVAVSDDDLPF